MRKMPPEGSNARLVLDALIKSLPLWPNAVAECGGEAMALRGFHELFEHEVLQFVRDRDGSFQLKLSGVLARPEGSA